jgi:hypothetical protein
MAAEDRIDRGEEPSAARVAALREFGNVTLVEDVTHDVWGRGRTEQLGQDLRFGLRMLRKNPGFTGVAIFTLALGIGANTAIFSVIDAVLLRPLPYPHSDRLLSLSERAPGLPLMYVSLANLADWRVMNTVFESLEGFRSTDVTLTGHGDPQRLAIRQVTAGFFPLLGVKPILGRALTPLEDKPGSKPVVLLSERSGPRSLAAIPGCYARSSCSMARNSPSSA